MEWIATHSALNQLFFMSGMAPPYTADPERFWYIDNICCCLILADGNPARPHDRIFGAPLLIFAYGTGSNIVSCFRFARRMAMALHIHVLLFDYPGYGCTTGAANERACCNSIERVLDHLITRMRAPLHQLILLGHSLGTGVASWGYHYGSNRYGPGIRLILLNPFLSLRRAAQHFTCFGSLIRERFRTDQLLASNPGRILIIHGQADTVIPVEQGWSLFHLTANIPMPTPTPSPLPEHIFENTIEGWFPLTATHDRFELSSLHDRIGAFIDDREYSDYVNDTPRIPPAESTHPSAIVPIIAAVGELTLGPTVDICEQCFFL